MAENESGGGRGDDEAGPGKKTLRVRSDFYEGAKHESYHIETLPMASIAMPPMPPDERKKKVTLITWLSRISAFLVFLVIVFLVVAVFLK